MSYQTNSYEVGTVLSFMGNRYSILDAFGTYPELTVDQYRSLSESDIQNRIEAFYSKLSNDLNVNVKDLVLHGNEAIRFNLNACPIGTYYKITPTANYGTARTADGNEMYRAGDAVHLISEFDDDRRVFEGWYVNDVLEHLQKEWSFFASRDLGPEARYSNEIYVTVRVGVADYVADRGSAEGGGVVPTGSEVSVYASADPGYVFAGWRVKGTTEIINANPSWTFIANEDISLEATFESHQQAKNTIYISAYFDKSNAMLTANASSPVTSRLSISLDWLIGNFQAPSSIEIEKGQSETAVWVSDYQSGKDADVRVASIDPTEDDESIYLISR